MRKFLRQFWVVVPVLASVATQCDQTPRGTIPSMLTSVNLVLTSVAADIPTDPDGLAAFGSCRQRMDGLPNHVRASWRGNEG